MSLMRTPAGRAGPNRMEPHLWKVVQEIIWHTQADGQAGRQAERQTDRPMPVLALTTSMAKSGP